MAYKDFTDLHELFKDSVQPGVAQDIRSMIESAASEISTINTVASRYARLYATVEQLVTDVSTTPPSVQDVTSAARQSVPDSAIFDAINVMNTSQESQKRLEELINAEGEEVTSQAMSGYFSYYYGQLLPLYHMDTNVGQVIASEYVEIAQMNHTSFKLRFRQVSNAADWSTLSLSKVRQALAPVRYRQDNSSTVVIADAVVGSVNGTPLHLATFGYAVSNVQSYRAVVWYQVGNDRYYHTIPTLSTTHPESTISLDDSTYWTVLTDRYRIGYSDLCNYANISSTFTTGWTPATSRLHAYYDGSGVVMMSVDWNYLDNLYESLLTAQASRVVGLGTAILHTVRVQNADLLEAELQRLIS